MRICKAVELVQQFLNANIRKLVFKDGVTHAVEGIEPARRRVKIEFGRSKNNPPTTNPPPPPECASKRPDHRCRQSLTMHQPSWQPEGLRPQLSAISGHLDALAKVGAAYCLGGGVETDWAVGEEILQMAANHGHPSAKDYFKTFGRRSCADISR